MGSSGIVVVVHHEDVFVPLQWIQDPPRSRQDLCPLGLEGLPVHLEPQCRSFRTKKNPRKVDWTVVYRRMHKKGQVEDSKRSAVARSPRPRVPSLVCPPSSCLPSATSLMMPVVPLVTLPRRTSRRRRRPPSRPRRTRSLGSRASRLRP